MSRNGSRSSNDQRSDVKNPNNREYEMDRDNRIAQGHSDIPPPPPSSSDQEGGETPK